MAPIIWLVLSSLMLQNALTSTPPDFAFNAFTLTNYVRVLDSAVALGRGFANSLIVAFSTTLIALTIGAPAAYALARLRLPGAGPILLFVLATQMFPGIVIAIPLFIAMSRMGLIDSRIGLIITYLSFNLPIVIWVLRGFSPSHPTEPGEGGGRGWRHRVPDIPSDRAAHLPAAALFATAVFSFIYEMRGAAHDPNATERPARKARIFCAGWDLWKGQASRAVFSWAVACRLLHSGEACFELCEVVRRAPHDEPHQREGERRMVVEG